MDQTERRARCLTLYGDTWCGTVAVVYCVREQNSFVAYAGERSFMTLAVIDRQLYYGRENKSRGWWHASDNEKDE